MIQAFRNLFGNKVQAAGYDGAKRSRFRSSQAGIRSFSKDEDRHIGAVDRDSLRLETRDLRRNYGIVFGMLDRFMNFVVGSGINPQAKTSDSGWNEDAESYWSEWCKVADARGRMTLNEMVQLVVKARIVEGECGFVLMKSGQLMPIESERIATPKGLAEGENEKIIQGIEVDQFGRSLKYHVCDRARSGLIDTGKSMAFDASDFVHVAAYERFDQIRGIPTLASVVNYLRDKGEFSDATLFTAKLQAWKAWAVYSDDDVGPGNLGPRDAGNTDDGSVRIEKNDQGELWYLSRGSKMEPLAPANPGNTYDPFTKNILREIGAAFGVPYPILMLDFADTNFSSSRAALMIAYNTFAIWQDWLVARMLQRVWNWRIAKAIKAGELAPAPVDNRRGFSEWYKVEWIPPSWEWVDPQSQAQANTTEWNMGVKTLTMIARQKGRDAEDLLREKGRDIKMAMDVAAEIGVDWRDLIMTALPGQLSKTQSEPDPAQDPKPLESPT